MKTLRRGSVAELCIWGAVFALTISYANPSTASGPGTTGANILNLPFGARAIAMGEAYTAQADDVSSIFWNPAGLALINQSQASFMYNQNIQEMAHSQAAVATPLENGAIGASLSYLTFGQINGYDVNNNPTGNVNANSGVATLTGAWLGENWSAGFNAKGVRASLADVSATGFASDLGLNLIYPKEVKGGTLRAGATIRNLGTGLKFIHETDPFPTEARIGVAAVQMANRKLNMSMDYSKVRDNKGSIYAGTEYWLIPMFALRAGYAGNHTESNGIRLGMGIRIRDLSFDYAYSQFGELGLSHRYEMTYRFGAIRPLLSPEERRILRQGKQALKLGHYSEAVLLFNTLIELEPGYRPTRPLIKLAMAGFEKDESYVKNTKTFRLIPGVNSGKPDNDPGEISELVQLLELDGTDSVANVMKPAVKAPTGGSL